MADESAVSEAEFETWLQPGRAEEQMRPIGATAYQAINEGVTSGRVRVTAELAQFGLGDENALFPIWPSEWPSPPWGAFWTTSNITLQISRDGTRERPVELFGVRFDPKGIERIRRAAGIQTPAEIEKPVSTAMVKSKGGAPRKDWWDHLWIEMIRRIRAGTLTPKSPAELETAMRDWLGEQDIYPGDDTLKPTKTNLFKYLKEISGEN